MKNFLVSLVLFLCTLISFAQTKPFKIHGRVISEVDSTKLEAATVYLQNIKDSTLISYTITDRKGEFILEDNSSLEKANLFISYVGFQTYLKSINLKNNTELNTIKLKEDTNTLDEVIVRGKAPITVKKDTLEFRVKSFKTAKDANVEDLLKELPGVEVDQDGKITINGKEVNQVLVNGKPFFGSDPTIATKNLSKDIIEKVQIVDTKTKAQAFAGESGNGQNKTINLTISKENDKGVFGRLAAGFGTDERYEYAGFFNRFKGDQRISILSGGNNINAMGFSFGEISKMFGGNIRGVNVTGNGGVAINGVGFGLGQGITTSNNSGVNYIDAFGDIIDVSGNYFYTKAASENESSNSRENILPDSRFFTESKASSTNDNRSHRFDTGLEFKLDSTLLITVAPRFSTSQNKSAANQSQSSRNGNRILVNESTSNSFTTNNADDFGNRLDVTKKLGAKGSFIKLYLNNSIGKRDSEEFFESTTIVYDENALDPDNLVEEERVVRDQLIKGDNKTNNLSTGIAYRLPLKGKALSLDFSYDYSNNNEKSSRSTLNKDIDGNYTEFDSDLSTDFEYEDRRNKPGVKLSYRKEKLTAELGAEYIIRTLENSDRLRPEFNIKRRFENLQLRSLFRYNVNQFTSWSVFYNLSNNPPQLGQLQAFENITNPLNTIIGNPNLKPTNSHNISTSFRKYSFQKGVSFFAGMNVQVTNNQIVSRTTINENLLRSTTYENVNGNYSITPNVGVGKRFKLDSLKTFTVNVDVRPNFRKVVNYNNDVKYSSKVSSIAPVLNMNFRWQDVMDVSTSYQASFTKNTFDLEGFQDEEFVSHTLSTRSRNEFFNKKLELQNTLTFNYNPNVIDGFQKSSWFWNSTLAYSILKDKATLTLKAYDILNQNTNARRTATANYIEDAQNTVLKRYFMLGFSWKFNTLGKKGQVNDYRFNQF